MKFFKEILWIFISIIIATMVLFPIVTKIDYKYMGVNVFIICLAVLYSRMYLDFKNLFYLKSKWIRFFLFAFNFFVVVSLIGKIQQNEVLFNTFTINSFVNSMPSLSLSKETSLIHYINKQFLVFGVIAIAATILFNIRILKSFWTNKSISEF